MLVAIEILIHGNFTNQKSGHSFIPARNSRSEQHDIYMYWYILIIIILKKKKLFSYFHCKRKVLGDSISTEPLILFYSQISGKKRRKPTCLLAAVPKSWWRVVATFRLICLPNEAEKYAEGSPYWTEVQSFWWKRMWGYFRKQKCRYFWRNCRQKGQKGCHLGWSPSWGGNGSAAILSGRGKAAILAPVKGFDFLLLCCFQPLYITENLQVPYTFF